MEEGGGAGGANEILNMSFKFFLTKGISRYVLCSVFILLKEEMVLVGCLVQVFTWVVNILTDRTSTNQFGLLSLTTLKNDVNRTEDEKHLKPTIGKK